MLKSKFIKRQKGLSLIELMVGMVVGLLILAAAGTSYIVSSRSGRDTIISTRLNMELRTAMGIMADEIRRAGATGDISTAGINNPFTIQTAGTRTDLQVNSAGNCIEFTYDANGNNSADTGSALENRDYAGFLVQNGILQVRAGGAGPVDNCTNGTWQPLSDPNTISIQPYGAGIPYFSITYQCINTLNNISQNVNCNSFTGYTGIASGTSADMLETRTISINIAGQSVQDTAMRMRISEQVLVRNHRIVVGVAP